MSTTEHSAKRMQNKWPKQKSSSCADSSKTPFKGVISKANPDIRRYVEKARKIHSKERWLSYPEIPTADEVMGQTSAIDQEEGMIDLAPNQIDEPWESRESYLSAHYELLREDTVALLRDAVAYVREEPMMTDTKEFCIYEQVYITGITFSPRGIATKVSFSTFRAGKNIVWEYSNRLLAGSMVAMSPANDCFKTQCLVAVVAARPLDQLKQRPRKVDLFFADTTEATFDTQQEWIMVQPRSGYFESTRHTMKTLQVMNGERFPLTEHICGLKREVDCPDYLKKDPHVKLFTGEAADILTEWPSEPQNNLDESQWEALHQILTKRLAIIQGPPGTGKTHVSVAALQLLLSGQSSESRPIVVAAHTNHALDQLLNHVAIWAPDYIRLGGRSLDEHVRQRTLFEIVKNHPNPRVLNSTTLSFASKCLHKIRETMTKFLEPFSLESSQEVLSATFFHQYGVITDKQYRLLCDGVNDWIGSQLEVMEPMGLWLGDAVVRHRISYEDDTFKHDEDEVDLEYEQLKEFEQEKEFLEDELEALRGVYIPLRETFIGRGSVDDNIEIHIDDLWQIDPGRRGSVYNALRQRAKIKLLSLYREHVQRYNAMTTERQIGRWERDYEILKDAKLIGITTTGLSKYRALLSALKPKIVMIEEAAETIEAPVTAACLESLEHLILIGDHKQLQGSCSVTDLEGHPFYLNVSMFERLLKNGIDFKTLTVQRRMVPEIRRLLTPIYEDLQDHKTVKELANVPAMGNVHSFFFCHHWPESFDSLFSKYNHNEALMVATFFVYLVLAGVKVNDITVLTFYNGQRKKILKLLKENRHLQGKRLSVVTVDSYQGEENQIVLLSLVRSSEDRGIGFLAVENRVCVALSRARRGFYLFGNAEKLASSSPLWWEVIQIMGGTEDVTSRRIGYYLPLTCENHGNREFVRNHEEIMELSGGCRVSCKTVLDCGHVCPLRCHVSEHSRIQCDTICGTTLSCGHTCGNKCSAETCLCSACGYWAKNPKFSVKDVASSSKDTQQENQNMQISVDTSAEMVRHDYRQFASGGVKEHDRIMEAARHAETEQDMLARLDAEAEANLFADDEMVESIPGPGDSTEMSIDAYLEGTVSDDKSTDDNISSRKRWVDSYDPAAGLQKLTVTSNEMSLLDL